MNALNNIIEKLRLKIVGTIGVKPIGVRSA